MTFFRPNEKFMQTQQYAKIYGNKQKGTELILYSMAFHSKFTIVSSMPCSAQRVLSDWVSCDYFLPITYSFDFYLVLYSVSFIVDGKVANYINSRLLRSQLSLSLAKIEFIEWENLLNYCNNLLDYLIELLMNKILGKNWIKLWNH